MAGPLDSAHADQHLVSYLLGLLSEEETERLDEQSVADDDVAERLRVVEHELIDAYVNGTLDTVTREQFERVYLASPRRREKVRFAESLRQAVDRAKPPSERADRIARVDGVERPLAAGAAGASGGTGGAGRPSAVRMHTDGAAERTTDGPRDSGRAGGVERAPVAAASPPSSGLMWALAAAAMLLLVAGGVLLFQTMRLRQELTAAQTERAALEHRARELERQVVDQQSANAEASKELARIREQLAGSTPRPGESSTAANTGAPGGTTTQTPSSTLSPIALVLLPQTRAAGPIPSVAIRPGATSLAFDLVLEANEFPRYQVALRDPGTNGVVWRGTPLTPTVTRQSAFITVVVPAQVLKAQHYTLDLSGLRASGDAEPLGSYAFRVVALR